MAQWVDIDHVSESVTFEQLFRHNKLIAEDYVLTGEEIKIPCPFEEEPTGKTLSANNTRNIFQCFRCRKSGDLITFTLLLQGINTGTRNQDRRRAAIVLQDWFNIKSERPKTEAKPKREESQEDVPRDNAPKIPGDEAQDAAEPHGNRPSPTEPDRNPPLSFPGLKKLDPTHPYLAEQELSQETIAHFGIGFCSTGKLMKGRIAIPLHDEDAVLIGYAGRYPGDPLDLPVGEPTYLFPPGFNTSVILFNLHRVREHAHEGLIVTEDFFTLFSLHQRGRKNVVSTMGASLSPKQERLLVEAVGPRGKVLICFGSHDSAVTGACDAVLRLAPQLFVRTITLDS